MYIYRDEEFFLKTQLKKILEMEKKGIFPNIPFILDSYNAVLMHCNAGNYETEYMYQLYSSFINKCIKESINILNNATNIDFIILFNKQIDRIKYILFFIDEVFICLDKYYTKKKKFTFFKRTII